MRLATPRIYFVRPTIEYCCGLCPAHEAEEVMAGVGLEDSQAALFRISREAIRARPAPPGEAGLVRRQC